MIKWDTVDGLADIIILLERAESVLYYLIDHGEYSWAKEHYEEKGWHDVISSYDQTTQFLNITGEYLVKALEKAREMEKAL